jgi:hypothetical protein
MRDASPSPFDEVVDTFEQGDGTGISQTQFLTRKCRHLPSGNLVGVLEEQFRTLFDNIACVLSICPRIRSIWKTHKMHGICHQNEAVRVGTISNLDSCRM